MINSLLILAAVCAVCVIVSLHRKQFPHNYHSYKNSLLSSFLWSVRAALGIDEMTEEADSETLNSIWLKEVISERYVLCEGDVTEIKKTEGKSFLLGSKYHITVKIKYADIEKEVVLTDPVFWKRTDRELAASDLAGRVYRYDKKTNTCKTADCDNLQMAFVYGALAMICILLYLYFTSIGI